MRCERFAGILEVLFFVFFLPRGLESASFVRGDAGFSLPLLLLASVSFTRTRSCSKSLPSCSERFCQHVAGQGHDADHKCDAGVARVRRCDGGCH